MSLKQFIETTDRSELALAVVNREAPRQLQTMLEELFEGQPVSIEQQERADEDSDMVYLLDDGEVLAASPLSELRDSILLVNSDLYITGNRDPADLDLPDVFEGLEDVRFRLRGFPDSSKEKLLLITISRYIERLGLEGGGGTHRASFQRLSRLADERGTKSVYRNLAETDTNTHVYGIPDWTPDYDVTVHGGRSQEFRDSWFVVYVPDDAAEQYSALVAVERSPRSWEGFWTFDAETVTEIEAYIRREL
ncbi:DICT sensory domain-containing protein [Halostagnicola bangensis]